MSQLLTYFSPDTTAVDLPEIFPSPFAQVPHSIAIVASEMIQRDLNQRSFGNHDFFQPGNGKMIGVLVVQNAEHEIAFLRAISGMVGRKWIVDGFMPPLFDLSDRETFWPAGQRRLDELGAESESLARGPIAETAENRRALQRRHIGEKEIWSLEMRERKALRAQRRTSLAGGSGSALEATRQMAELSSESQSDRKRTKAQRARQREEMELLKSRQEDLERERLAIKASRTAVSNELLDKIQAGYRIVNAKGDARTLRSFYEPAIPPGGSGDCAAPKLLGYANTHNLRPIALAEFWWGASPSGAVRHHKHFYPPCKGRCQPILGFMLGGVSVEESPIYGQSRADKGQPRTLFDDSSLAIVNKPAGLLSVPGAIPQLQDSVLTRLQARYPDATGPLLVHRLDLDTTGLLVMAKNADVYRDLQNQFAAREVEKTYLAWVVGQPPAETGRIELPLRVDLNDRPRQIVCFEHGKASATEYEVLERRDATTLVRFRPLTGRTHQLRVHASHPLGLGTPIVGDRLYGRPGGPLLLHAKAIVFAHPTTGQKYHVECPLPLDWPE